MDSEARLRRVKYALRASEVRLRRVKYAAVRQIEEDFRPRRKSIAARRRRLPSNDSKLSVFTAKRHSGINPDSEQ